MKKHTLLSCIILLLLLCGCGRSFYYSNDCVSDDYAVIDNTSKVFVRKLYLNDQKEKTKDSVSANKENTLIEVQYLIFNPNKEIIYIATTPSRYIYDKTNSYLIHSKKNEYPNGFYLNTFYFGKDITVNAGNSKIIEFKNKKFSEKWNFIQKDEDNIELMDIDKYKIKKVLIEGEKQTEEVFQSTEKVGISSNYDVKFEKIHRFKYLSFKIPDDSETSNKMSAATTNDESEKNYTIYDKNCNKKDTLSKYKLYPSAKRIYFKSSNKKLQYIFIPFSMDIIENYHSIKFKSNRVKFMKE